MADYGHDLQFGTFITPVAAGHEHVLSLAQLTDQLGLDLVTVQDHPYQAKFLDTWTLLSVIAAQTVNVRVAPNVVNLPLRPPAVLARSAASLDLLSGGRVELGLGAGAFWDAIVANGGPRRTPGEGVEALEEAIGIVRDVWAADGGSVRRRGTHYDVHGAHPGPAPAHDIGIWVGAYKPRMLRLTGRLADGWLPSLGYLSSPDDLTDLNRVIDDAARAADRSPQAVRRLLNVNGRFTAPGAGRGLLVGPPAQWAEQLTEIALTHGTSTFILGSDDPDDIRRFATEVAPAVREAVEGERLVEGTAPTPEPARATSVAGTEPGAPAAPDSPAGTAPSGTFAVVPTPDDGARLSDVRVWDEDARPTAPPPPADHRYTAHDNATGQHLIDVHDHLRAELTRVRELVDQVAAGHVGIGDARDEINTMTMRQNNWTLGTYCESYCRVVTTHHTLEDRSLFPHLRDADAGLVPVVDRLEEEHRAIHGVLEGVDRALVAFVGEEDPTAGTERLREAVDLLTDTLLSHLSYEERELVEPLARLGLG
ncbi:LLM class flavin-dependent oxidoreductase [Oerskovia flava]|uniref:LLM class flavin-dependent oxidoreductase n=1 Tax=Oerskovia flava TaxID=2986422 RepID=UPI002240D191|nr:LLM class flavin-dependent oxidoreductase [Oerskovia sp. JB1-3-2]